MTNMRLIDADALKDNMRFRGAMVDDNHLLHVPWVDVSKSIDNAPTVDAVPVVRCKDCCYWNRDTIRQNSNDVAWWNEAECKRIADRDGWNEINQYTSADWFCEDGERREDDGLH